MSTYSQITQAIIDNGRLQENRTGTDTISIFGAELRYDLSKEFPAITDKRAFVRGGVAELNWMLAGSTSVLDLHKRDVHFWDGWAIKGLHEVPKHVNELMREYYAKGHNTSWEDACELISDVNSAIDPVELLCKQCAISMTKIVDDRLVYKAATLHLIIKAMEDSHRGSEKVDCQAIVRRLYSVAPNHTDDRKFFAYLLDSLQKEGYNLRTVHTQDNIVLYLMDEMNFTRQTAIDMVGYEPLEAVVERLHIPEFLEVCTCKVGDLGPVYGYNWRHWPTPNGGEIDQISDLVKQIRTNPTSRRHILHFWNPTLLPDERYTPQENVARGKMALAPCHWMCEFRVDLYTEEELRASLNPVDHDCMFNDDGTLLDLTFLQLQQHCRTHHFPVGKLNIHPHMRSWDFAAGAPVNLVFYAAFCHMMAAHTCLAPGKFWMTGMDVHLYVDQIDLMKEMLTREDRPLPQFKLKSDPWCPTFTIFDYKDDCYELLNYNPHDAIRVPVAI